MPPKAAHFLGCTGCQCVRVSGIEMQVYDTDALLEGQARFLINFAFVGGIKFSAITPAS